MKTLTSSTLIATALFSMAATVSATALTGPASASMAEAHTSPMIEPMNQHMSLHMAQHLALRTHVAANVMHLAQASQAAPVDAGPAQTAPQTHDQKPHSHAHQHGKKHAAQHGLHRENLQARRSAHHEALKAKLQLTPEQEPAWLAFTARMEASHGMKEKSSGDRVDWSKLTTPERLDQMQARMAERQSTMNQRFDAIRSFYAALNPEQQKVFDSQHAGRPVGGHHRTGMKGHGAQGDGSHQNRHHHHKHLGSMGTHSPAAPQS